jgi:hypothetical protein
MSRIVETLPAPPVLKVAWRANGRVTLPFDAPTDLRSSQNLDIRVIVDPTSEPADLKARITDSTGRTVDVVPELPRLAPLPGATGRSLGLLEVIDDDPQPELTVSPAALAVRKGETATWTVNLSAPLADIAFVLVRFAPPETGPELTVFDLSVEQRTRLGIDPTAPDVPLSELSSGPTTEIPIGATTATINLAIGLDDLTEGDESTVLILDASTPLIVNPGRVSLTVAPPP